MPQILKDEIRERIREAALNAFFEKDFRSCTMQEIALKAKIPTGLIYTYFKNKEALFEEVVSPAFLYRQMESLQRTEQSSPFDRLSLTEKNIMHSVFVYYKEFIILLDKSKNSKFENEKDYIVQMMEMHLRTAWSSLGKSFDPLLPRLMAVNYVESVLEILRNYESLERCEKLLNEVTKLLFPKV